LGVAVALRINQGPIVVMIENYGSGLVWRLTRECPAIVAGLRAVGFAGGWISHTVPQGDAT
jgi:hypothetical protein